MCIFLNDKCNMIMNEYMCEYVINIHFKVETGRIEIQGQPGQIACETSTQQTAGSMCKPVISCHKGG
jgi:hypothetical protein